MDKVEQFYLHMIRYDLDSVEADTILAAEGVELTEETVSEALKAIQSWAIYVPGGPVYNWGAIYKKIESNYKGEWIPVGVMLPNENRKVVTLSRTGAQVQYLRHDQELAEWWWWGGSQPSAVNENYVTHWLTIPEQPKNFND